ncbi:unnamed protein product, partial [Enterobius vermicularis]|uniref:Major facilitator superfamily domain-containing protein 6 n=1 Tax=Enterobius vermicularis TaxID=51028 RepID=A0A0N4UXX9_ENTVE
MIGYGFGHFYNDLCASMWFTYLMIFLENVLGFRSSISGLLMLIGQHEAENNRKLLENVRFFFFYVVDAVCNPLVGIASDSSLLPAWFENRIGKRMSWHVIGTISVTVSFPFIFNKCPVCSDTGSEWWPFAWFVFFISIFQFGWSAVQIAHLALIPELSQSPSARATMSSL